MRRPSTPASPALLAIACCWLAFSGCGQMTEQTPAYTVYGTLTSTTVSVSGKLGWVKLVGETQGLNDPALYHTACVIQGPSCDYKINFVPEGNYTAFGVIDMDNNVVEPEVNPDPDDLVTGSRPVFLLESTRIDFPDSAWRSMP